MDSPYSDTRHILIFKTNIRFKKDVEVLKKVLSNDPSIIRWTVDRDDYDKILRIESRSNNITQIVSYLIKAGFDCEELPDYIPV